MKAQPGARIEPHSPQQLAGDSKVTGQMAGATSRSLARIAGGLYLIVIVGGFFAVGYVPGAIVVSGDAVATARNILAHELLYRLGLAVHAMILLCNIPLAVIFYDLFRVVNRRVSLFVAFFTLVGSAIEGLNLLNQFAPLLLLGGGRYLSAFTSEQLQSLAYIPLELQTIGFNLALVFFGLYGLSIGYLIFKSTFLPRILGVLMVIGGLCYLTNSLATFLSPGFAASLFPYIQVPSGVAELSLTLWLLIAGLNAQRWKEQASASGTGNRA